MPSEQVRDVREHHVPPLVGQCAVGAEKAGDDTGSGVGEGNVQLSPGVLDLTDESAELVPVGAWTFVTTSGPRCAPISA